MFFRGAGLPRECLDRCVRFVLKNLALVGGGVLFRYLGLSRVYRNLRVIFTVRLGSWLVEVCFSRVRGYLESVVLAM